MDSNAKAMKLFAGRHGRFKSHSIRKQSGAGYHAVAVSVQNSSVHAFRQAKIVRVYDKPLHWFLSVTTSSGVRALISIFAVAGKVRTAPARLAIMK